METPEQLVRTKLVESLTKIKRLEDDLYFKDLAMRLEVAKVREEYEQQLQWYREQIVVRDKLLDILV